MKVTKEIAFEDAIVDWLVGQGGYSRGVATNYDPANALDSAELFAFIGATQADEWEELVKRNGGDPDLVSGGSWSVSPSRSTNAGRSTCFGMALTTSACTSAWRTSGQRPA